MNRSSDFRLPNINQNNFNLSLNPPSLSRQFLNYTKNQLRNGEMNPNGFRLNQNPAWLNNNEKNPYQSLFAREGMVYNKIRNNNLIDQYPLAMTKNSGIIREAELVRFPEESFVPLSKLENFLDNKSSKPSSKFQSPKKSKDEQYKERLMKKLEEKNELKRKNRKKWGFIKRSIHILSLYRLIQNFTKGSIDIKANKLLHIQAAKEGLIQIRNCILPVLGNIEDFCTEFFHSTLIYNTQNMEKQKNTVFIVKSFLHQFFSDLTSAFAKFDDIPAAIKKVFKLYISEKATMPYGFLTTFEFNRLEFSQKIKLKNMNKERQAMLICFILLYRIILIDVFKRYEKYFPKIRDMRPKEEKIESKIMKNYNDLQKERIIQEKRRRDIERGNIDPNTLNGADEEETEEMKIIKKNIAIKNKNNRRIVMTRSTEPPACPPKRKPNAQEDVNYYQFGDEDEVTIPPMESARRRIDSKKQPVNKKRNLNNKSLSRKNSVEGESRSKSKKSNSNKKQSVSQKKRINPKKNANKRGREEFPNRNSSRMDNRYQDDSRSKRGSSNPKSRSRIQSGRRSTYERDPYLNSRIHSRESSLLSRRSQSGRRPQGNVKGRRPVDDRNRSGTGRNSQRERNQSGRRYPIDRSQDRRRIQGDRNQSGRRYPEYKRTQSGNKNSKILRNQSGRRRNVGDYNRAETYSRSNSRGSSKKGPYTKRQAQINFWGEDLRDEPIKTMSKEERAIEEARRAVRLLPSKEKMRIIEKEEEKLKNKINHNFNFIINVLHHVFKTAIEENVPRFKETFKEKHCYKVLVYKKSETLYSSDNDEIELIQGVVLNPKVTDDFIRHNYRWLQMYIFNTFQFCVDFSRKVYID